MSSTASSSAGTWFCLKLMLAVALALSGVCRSSHAEVAAGARTAQLERALRGVVALERAGRRIALGTILNGDGRILTALSALSHGNDLSARYHDGSVSRLRVVHTNRAWDLALLVPLDTNVKEGLKAARLPTIEARALRRPRPAGPRTTLVRMDVTPTASLLGHDGAVLGSVLRLSQPVAASELGVPLLNDELEVVAIVARACAAGSNPCRLDAYGVPVTALRAFLKAVSRAAELPTPWIGARGVAARTALVHGLRITEVAPGSPAELAGLRAGSAAAPGDIIVAVSGTPVSTAQNFAAAMSKRTIGDRVTLLVFSEGKYRSVEVAVAAAPTGQAAPPKTPLQKPGQKPVQEPRSKRNSTRKR